MDALGRNPRTGWNGVVTIGAVRANWTAHRELDDFMKALRSAGALTMVMAMACGGDPAGPGPTNPGTSGGKAPAMTVLGHGTITSRYTAEVWAHGGYAYTTTWGTRFAGGVGVPGNTMYIWSVAGATPTLVDSVLVAGVNTLGDVQVTPDGRYLVIPTERDPGSIITYDLSDPTKPQLLSRFTSPKITRGVHTTEIQTVNGRLYAFLSVNGGEHPPRLMIVDLTDPSQPSEVFTRDISGSFIHDVYVRDGILFTAEWNNGMVIFDIGGGGKGGTVANPVQLGTVRTAGGKVHNIFWFHDPSTGAKRYAFVGEEGAATLFTASSGDLHVVDVSDLSAPREVAFLRVPGAGAHNVSMDEPNGFLYAAFYNGGVQALDVRGDLAGCAADAKAADGRCDLKLMGRVKAVGLATDNSPVFIWGVHYTGTALYASDMLNGLWKLTPLAR